MAVAVSSLLAFSARGATFSTNSFADAFVTTGPSGNRSNTNYGGAGALAIAAPGLSKGEFQSVLQFDASLAKSAFDALYGAGAWSVQSASLQFSSASANNAIFNATASGHFQVYWMQNDSWTEGSGTPNAPRATGITFNSLQNTFVSPSDQNLGTFSYDGSTSGNSAYTLSLSSGLTADLLAGNEISFRLVAADTTVSYIFNSHDFPTSDNWPVFTITVIPEPPQAALGALVLFLAAGRGIIARRRRARGKADRPDSPSSNCSSSLTSPPVP